MTSPRQASLDWVERAIRQADPADPDPRGLAERMLRSAERNQVRIENLVESLASGLVTPRQWREAEEFAKEKTC